MTVPGSWSQQGVRVLPVSPSVDRHAPRAGDPHPHSFRTLPRLMLPVRHWRLHSRHTLRQVGENMGSFLTALGVF